MSWGRLRGEMKQSGCLWGDVMCVKCGELRCVMSCNVLCCDAIIWSTIPSTFLYSQNWFSAMHLALILWPIVQLQYHSVLQSTTPVLLCNRKYYNVLLQYYSVLQSTTPVLLCTAKYYSSTTLYCKVLLQYYSVLQSTTPVLLCTTRYYSSTTPYCKVLLQYYSVLQSATPVLLCTTRYYSSTTLYYKVLLQY